MKKILTSMAAIALSLIIAFSSISAEAKGGSVKADKYFDTYISADQDYITVTLDLKKKSELTSGQVILGYDPSVMSLLWSCENDAMDIEDLNLEYDDGKISFAWTSNEAAYYGETLYTLSFRVKNAKDKQVVSFTTSVKEAYQNFKPIESGEDKTASVKLKMPKKTSYVNESVKAVKNSITKIVTSILSIFW